MGRRGRIFRDDGKYVIWISEVHGKGRRVRWHVDAFFRGHRKSTRACKATGSPEAAEAYATALWQQYLSGALEAPDAPPATLGELVERFCRRSTGKRGRPLSEKTRRVYKAHLGALLAMAGDGCPLGHVSRVHVAQACDRPPAQASKAAYLRSANALFNWAVRNKWLATNPALDVEIHPGIQRMRPFLQPDEVDAFLESCSPSHRIRAAVLLETGMRGGEAVSARWSWILRGAIGRPSVRIPEHDPESGFQTKARQARGVPLSEKAQEALENARQMWPAGDYILHDQQFPIRIDNWCRDTVRACRLAKVTRIDTHGLRRTAGVLWLLAGMDIYVVSRLLGHASVTTTERAYAGVTDGHLAREFDRVDERANLPKLPVRRNKKGKDRPWTVAPT